MMMMKAKRAKNSNYLSEYETLLCSSVVLSSYYEAVKSEHTPGA